MKKYFFSIIGVFTLLFISFFLFSNNTFAQAVNIAGSFTNADKITGISINGISGGTNTVETIELAGRSILTTIKTLVAGVMVIYIVYAGIQMIISMGTDEEKLSSAKRQLWYTIVAFVFINIPGSLYNAFNSTATTTITNRTTYSSWFNTPGNETNLFIDAFSLGRTLNGDIVGFITILISFIAIVMIIIAGLNLMAARGRDEKITEAKDKIKWSIVALLLVGFLESWKYLVFSGDIDDGGNLFETVTNLALFFAGPIAIIFLTIAAYTFITSNGNEEKVKKAKSIVINVIIATIILLAAYTFLLDLITL